MKIVEIVIIKVVGMYPFNQKQRITCTLQLLFFNNDVIFFGSMITFLEQ